MAFVLFCVFVFLRAFVMVPLNYIVYNILSLNITSIYLIIQQKTEVVVCFTSASVR